MGVTAVNYPSKRKTAVYLVGIGTGFAAPQLFFNLINAALNSEMLSSVAGNKADLLSTSKLENKKPANIILYIGVVAGLAIGAYKLAGLVKQFFIGVAIGFILRMVALGIGIDIPFTYETPQTGENLTNATTGVQTFN
jgi:hypothetical protein